MKVRSSFHEEDDLETQVEAKNSLLATQQFDHHSSHTNSHPLNQKYHRSRKFHIKINKWVQELVGHLTNEDFGHIKYITPNTNNTTKIKNKK